MKILAKAGRDDIAIVYIAELEEGKQIEFVESIQPPIPREKKWVLIISSLYGCPVKCKFCDAGGYYKGKLSFDDLIKQIEFLISQRFPDKKLNVERFKIQFARMGEPSFNDNVIDVIEKLPSMYEIPCFIPSLSTVAPIKRESFFERLLEVKTNLYPKTFQLQFSIHTTDKQHRDWLIPIEKWDFKKISLYGEKFYQQGGKKITLNFALAKTNSVDQTVLLDYFNPEKFIIKVTPVNPTYQANKNNLESYVKQDKTNYTLIDNLKNAGYDVILSIGEYEENYIGSNCGQYLTNYLNREEKITQGYSYKPEVLNTSIN